MLVRRQDTVPFQAFDRLRFEMATSPSDSQEEAIGVSVLSVRSVLLGTIMCVLISILGPTWCYFLHSSNLFLNYSMGGAMFFLFLLVLVINGVLGMLWRRLAFRPGEMVVVAAMMLIASAITTLGLSGNLIPNMTAPYYLATPENRWEQELWPYLPQWTAPLDPAERA